MACEFSEDVECPCKKTSCVNHGKCCDCVKRHRGKEYLPACLVHIQNIVEEKTE